MTIDPKKLALAREWAEWVKDSDPDVYVGVTVRAAADTISSLPDSWVDADKLREVINNELSGHEHGTVGHHVAEEFACKLEPLLPDPEPRTLADMTAEERAECQWMQATFTRSHHDHIITAVYGSKSRILRKADGASFEIANEDLVPHPDLPKLEWPGSEPEDDTPAPEPASPRPDGCCGACPETVGGGVDCTCADNPRCPNRQPRPEDVPVEELWQVEIDGETAIGYRNDPEHVCPWFVTYRSNSRGDWLGDEDVTLVSRLVPETTETAYIYTDRDGDEWECIDGWWFTGDTHAKRAAKREYRVGRTSLPEEYGPYTRIEKEESDA